jgi:hypothetical protein
MAAVPFTVARAASFEREDWKGVCMKLNEQDCQHRFWMLIAEHAPVVVSSYPLFTVDGLQPRKRLACAANSTPGNSRCEEKRWACDKDGASGKKIVGDKHRRSSVTLN